MTGARWVLLGLARPRLPWFAAVGRDATSGALPAEFLKCVSAEEVRVRLAGGRRCSAVLLDGGLPGVDRDLLAAVVEAGAAAVVVDAGRGERDWRALGAVRGPARRLRSPCPRRGAGDIRGTGGCGGGARRGAVGAGAARAAGPRVRARRNGRLHGGGSAGAGARRRRARRCARRPRAPGGAGDAPRCPRRRARDPGAGGRAPVGDADDRRGAGAHVRGGRAPVCAAARVAPGAVVDGAATAGPRRGDRFAAGCVRGRGGRRDRRLRGRGRRRLGRRRGSQRPRPRLVGGGRCGLRGGTPGGEGAPRARAHRG